MSDQESLYARLLRIEHELNPDAQPEVWIGPKISLRRMRWRYRRHRFLVFLHLRHGVKMEVRIYDE